VLSPALAKFELVQKKDFAVEVGFLCRFRIKVAAKTPFLFSCVIPA
jgi:hypothetical protein